MLAIVLALVGPIYSQTQKQLPPEQAEVLKKIREIPEFSHLDPLNFNEDPDATLPKELRTLFHNHLKNHPQVAIRKALQDLAGADWVERAEVFGAHARRMIPLGMNGKLSEYELVGADAFKSGNLSALTPADFYAALRVQAWLRLRRLDDVQSQADFDKFVARTKKQANGAQLAKAWLQAYADLQLSQIMLELFDSCRLEDALVAIAPIQRFAPKTIPSLGPWVPAQGHAPLKSPMGPLIDVLNSIEQFRRWAVTDLPKHPELEPATAALGAGVFALWSAADRFPDARIQKLNELNQNWKRVVEALERGHPWEIPFKSLAPVESQDWLGLSGPASAAEDSSEAGLPLAALSQVIALGLWDAPAEYFVWDAPQNANWPAQWFDRVADLSLRLTPEKRADLRSRFDSDVLRAAMDFLDANDQGKIENSVRGFTGTQNPWAHFSVVGLGNALGNQVSASDEALKPVRDWLDPYQAVVEAAVAQYRLSAEEALSKAIAEQEEADRKLVELMNPYEDVSKAPVHIQEAIQQAQKVLHEAEEKLLAANRADDEAANVLVVSHALGLYRSLRGNPSFRADRSQALVNEMGTTYDSETNLFYFLQTLRSPGLIARLNPINNGRIDGDDRNGIDAIFTVLKRRPPASKK